MKLLLLLALTLLTGNFWVSLLLLVAFYWGVDRFTLGILPDPWRFFARVRRKASLESALVARPNDRQAQVALAEIMIEKKRFARAMELLRPSLEAGDEDPGTVFAMGVACAGEGHFEQAERLFSLVEELRPGFRSGEVDLARGRMALARGDLAHAKASLESLVKRRSGTVEGRVLLARALKGLGEQAASQVALDAAWAEHASAPTFVQRRQRVWAWRAKPLRPLAYLAFGLCMAFLVYQVIVPSLTGTPAPSAATVFEGE